MRVISGSAKRLQLKTLEGLETRPTTDRIKETLFNMISYGIYDSVFLDMFSGSGAIGIEALSRGAKEGFFIESNPKAIKLLNDNLQHTKLMDRAVVLSVDFLQGLKTLEGSKVFDYIFMDPPYNCGLEKDAIEYLANSKIINENTIIIIECAKESEMDYVGSLGFSITREKSYKTNKHVFIRIR